MKKSTLILIIICIASIQLFSQKKNFQIGLSGGVNSSNTKKIGSGFEGWYSMNSGVSYLMSLDFSYELNPNFWVKIGLGYNMNRFNNTVSGLNGKYSSDFNISHINFPLYGHLTSTGKIKFYTNIGVRMQLVSRKELTIKNLEVANVTELSSSLYNSGFGYLLGVGVSFPLGEQYSTSIEPRMYRQFNTLFKDIQKYGIKNNYHIYSFALVVSFTKRFHQNKELIKD